MIFTYIFPVFKIDICLKGVKSAIFKIVLNAEDSGRSIRIVRFAGKQ